MISKDSIVTLYYTMRNGRGEILEDKRTSYHHGSSEISPRLQSQLEGLQPGDHRLIVLHKGEEDADDDFSFDIVIEAVHQAASTPMQIHLLSGFLGSGKTTAIVKACRLLSKKGIRATVITNDQGSHLVDGQLFQHLNIPSRQVTNGCFCCNYNDLDAAIRSLTGQGHPAIRSLPGHHPAILFAESVGSCTDLVATVLKPLLQQYPRTAFTVSAFADATLLGQTSTFDPDVHYIYLKQLEEAQVIVVSKIDQIEDQATLRHLMTGRYPGKTILYQDSFNEDHISHWLQTLEHISPGSNTLPSLDIDYDLYGAGEARLAWLDQDMVIESPSHNAQNAALTLIYRLSETSYPIGHLKCLLDGATKISFTPSGSTGHIPIHPTPSATLLINARIQTTPAALTQLMADAIRATEKEHDCTIHTLSASCFQPGYPRPIHRIA